MSNPESFIDEVTEEVRRDKLFAMFRKYGWIGVLLVLLIVGGAAWTEWQKARAQSQARAFGDALLGALDADTPEARIAALSAVEAKGDQVALKGLLLSSDPVKDRAGALQALAAVEADATLPPVWRDLAVLRRVILQGAEAPLADRRAALEPLAQPGRPYRTMAAEQLAYLLIEEGRKDEAITALRALTQDQEAPGGLRNRASQMIVALGGDPAQG
ncbi:MULTISPECIES: hypothetical protein [Gemmobacter]|uniref:Tetratricopeptide repeat-like domain-containing protein n=2 Tax=Gemmobacter TaxID=204456 RepID=A0A2T6BBD0_9RHOB|nr:MULTISPECIES: hypothetical protein [Gemmobacter]OJY27314.1 MAG: hypothetical protein BGP11_14650 [Rhodobacterales bacterium 65-51]PTX53375.1 hypothetical protein C8N34_101290 [Gemmobacter caeni]TWJ05486.1 hypothetical protein IQ03_00288 [Gemmobacter caeni]GHC15715.1 hypothetical protein GCM10007291_12440 [Gemmobacter nanjingensis]